jgi:Shugoshin C terminus
MRSRSLPSFEASSKALLHSSDAGGGQQDQQRPGRELNRRRRAEAAQQSLTLLVRNMQLASQLALALEENRKLQSQLSICKRALVTHEIAHRFAAGRESPSPPSCEYPLMRRPGEESDKATQTDQDDDEAESWINFERRMSMLNVSGSSGHHRGVVDASPPGYLGRDNHDWSVHALARDRDRDRLPSPPSSPLPPSCWLPPEQPMASTPGSAVSQHEYRSPAQSRVEAHLRDGSQPSTAAPMPTVHPQSPPLMRQARSKPISYKEPSLLKKMRRPKEPK